MTIALIVASGLVWWAAGVAGFVFHWTYEYDLTSGDLVGGCITGVAGPVTWILGFFIHHPRKPSRVIVKSRQQP